MGGKSMLATLRLRDGGIDHADCSCGEFGNRSRCGDLRPVSSTSRHQSAATGRVQSLNRPSRNGQEETPVFLDPRTDWILQRPGGWIWQKLGISIAAAPV